MAMPPAAAAAARSLAARRRIPQPLASRPRSQLSSIPSTSQAALGTSTAMTAPSMATPFGCTPRATRCRNTHPQCVGSAHMRRQKSKSNAWHLPLLLAETVRRLVDAFQVQAVCAGAGLQNPFILRVLSVPANVLMADRNKPLCQDVKPDGPQLLHHVNNHGKDICLGT